MLQEPIHLRLERLESWQHIYLYGLLVRAHVPELHILQEAGRFGDGRIYRRILDLIWETLTVLEDARSISMANWRV
ncbi:DUF416 family protein [Salmonella enterica subsp. enterica]|nr:DUF416 family protein [Salmonella enterica subsp. enterica]